MEPSINGRLLGMDGYIMVERRRDIEQQFNGKCIHVGQQYLDRRINVYSVHCTIRRILGRAACTSIPHGVR